MRENGRIKPWCTTLAKTPADRRQRGFTLVELVVSLVVSGLVIAAMGSAVFFILMAQSQNNSVWRAQFDGAAIAARITADLQGAVSFGEHSAHAVEFTVPDRDGNGEDDTICYAFSGNAGDPLTLTYNQEPPVVLAPSVQAFDLTYQLGDPLATPMAQELAVLMYHDHAPKASMKDFSLDANHGCAQYFLPTFPTGTTIWKIKRVRIMARADGSKRDGVIKIRITTAGPSHQPTATVLDEATVLETSLDDTYGWADVDFTSLNDLDPTQGLCVVIIQMAGSDSAGKIQYEENGVPMTAGTFWMTTSNAGQSWTTETNSRDMRFYVYGTYDTYTGADTTKTVNGIGLTLQIGPTTQTRVVTSTRVLNAPEVVQP